MYKFLIASALIVACAGVPRAGEFEPESVRPVREEPVTESDLVGHISDNVHRSEHYDRGDPSVSFGDWSPDYSRHLAPEEEQ